MKMDQLASLKNLKLAWRRITTGNNYQYKRLFRHIYYTYELALDKNLADLRVRLMGGSFRPQPPERIYLPKASGLHRPLALLNIEDQIVLQAFANLAAEKLQRNRSPLQFKTIFSNILEKSDSIFFFQRWQETYRAFQKTIEKKYANGLRWVGDFDLAAFYDTVSHGLLLRTIYPRTVNADLEWLSECLRTWSSDQDASKHGHGLPQGPLASDFLAECFLLPIDLTLKKRRGYLRYVDDVRLLGKSENDVRADLLELERHCRERGLIPQSGKFAIKRAHSIKDAMGMLPSISDPHQEHSTDGQLDKKEALALLRSSLDGKPYRVKDKTRLRYVLYRAPPNTEILRLVLKLIPHHPEHTDAFFEYLNRFGYRKSIENLCCDLILGNPYPYVRGEAWHILTEFSRTPKSLVAMSHKAWIKRSVEIAKNKTRENFVERWGACHFLCVAEDVSGGHYSRWLKHQAPLLQSLLAPALPQGAFRNGELAEYFLKRTSPEPGLAICPALHSHRLTIDKMGLTLDQVPSQVANTLQELGLSSTPTRIVDPIAEILKSRYGLKANKSWHNLLENEYAHALGLLKLAEATFAGGRSFWLICQNSFNQTIFLALQRYLRQINHAGVCTTVDGSGRLIDFGVTLDSNGPFSRNFPDIATCFREVNARRNRLPPSHPYEKKTAAQSQHLKTSERNIFVGQLRIAYSAFSGQIP